MIKKILMGALCVMVAFTALSGCNFFRSEPGFALDRVSVRIKAEYQQEFENKEYTVEDFEWENTRAVIYLDWYDNILEPYGAITIYLNNTGEQKVLDAIKHFETLSFVKDAIECKGNYLLDRIKIEIKQEYQLELNNKNYTMEDFTWDNIRMILYQTCNDDSTSYLFIEIILNESGKEKIISAIEHFETLNFVESARELEEHFIYNKVLISVKSEFQEEFDNLELTAEDFMYGNIERISYIGFDPNNYIEITLKQHGREEILDAIEYFQSLNFVREANWANSLYAF